MYFISCIIPIFNSEEFLRETIESVIKQNIGFEKIQLILINDGSIDNSEYICLDYVSRYNNIEYHFQNNFGVSKARNFGLSFAKGEYISFLDADDLLEENFYNVGVGFLEANNVDMVAYPIKKMVNNILKEVPFPPRFETERVIDVKKEYKLNQFSASSVLIRRNTIGNIKFNEKMHFSEDAEFIHKIVLKGLKYGVTNKSYYIYRKIKTSATKSKLENLNWYYKDFQNIIINYSIDNYGFVTKYTQYLCLYELTSFYIKKVPIEINYEALKESLIKTLKFIDRDIIENANMKSPYKLFLYRLKGYEIEVFGNENIFFTVGKLKIEMPISVNILNIIEEENKVSFKGYLNLPSYKGLELVIKNKEEILEYRLTNDKSYDNFFLGESIHKAMVFEVEKYSCCFEDIKIFLKLENKLYTTLVNKF